MDNPFDDATVSYSRVRPGYPSEVVDLTLAAPEGGTLRAADIGAGTGKMTRLLLERGVDVDAVEPAPAMRAQLEQLSAGVTPRCSAGASAALPGASSAGHGPGLRVVDATAEDTGLPDAREDLVTCAQAWHWLDEEAASCEVHRILRPGGAVAVVWNQMDVSVPWIHRLTRIMRSGDVHRPDRPPRFGEHFTAPGLTQVTWSDHMTPGQLMELGTTRSSYLRAGPVQRRVMQENLAWYLLEHHDLDPEVPVAIPYTTMLWTALRV
ncbi:MAG: class I SAM-dependent methyltransferase [Pauljensenia sp.]